MQEKIKVMVDGPSPNSGRMAREVIKHVIESDDMELCLFSFTGPEVVEDYLKIDNSHSIKLIKPYEKQAFIDSLSRENFPDVNVNYTCPSAVNESVDFYCSNDMPFVMGTTGGDRKALERRVGLSRIPAVIAPNMAAEVVAFQDVMEDLAENLEGQWTDDGYSGLYIRESHQGVDVPNKFKGKKDISGTAKALVKIFQKIGIPDDISQIAPIRDREDQLKLGVPEEHLDGHAWHRYKLWAFPESSNQPILDEIYSRVSQFLINSPVFSRYHFTDSHGLSGFQDVGCLRILSDNSVMFRVEKRKGEVKADHNLNGRNAYVLGTLRAVRFTHEMRIDGYPGKFDMFDVLS